jgi:hypothetical protein
LSDSRTIAQTQDVWVPILELDSGDISWEAACECVTDFPLAGRVQDRVKVHLPGSSAWHLHQLARRWETKCSRDGTSVAPRNGLQITRSQAISLRQCITCRSGLVYGLAGADRGSWERRGRCRRERDGGERRRGRERLRSAYGNGWNRRITDISNVLELINEVVGVVRVDQKRRRHPLVEHLDEAIITELKYCLVNTRNHSEDSDISQGFGTHKIIGVQICHSLVRGVDARPITCA